MAVKNKTRSARLARSAQLKDHASLPADLPRVRTSERGTFKMCRWKWWVEFAEMRKPITPAPALRFGSLIHKALADYYPPGVKRGPHPAASFRKYYQEELDELQELFGQRVKREAEDDEYWVEAGTLGEDMMNRYVEKYGKDNQWKVLVTEQRFDILVRHPVTGKPWFVYCGVIDLVMKDRETDRVWIWDHKTAKAIMTKYLSLDDQSTAYWTYGWDWIVQAGLVPPDTQPAGMMFSIMRKALKDSRPQNAKGHYLNKDGSVSKSQPPAYFLRQPIYRDFNEREQARRRVLVEFAEMERVRKEGITQAYKTPGQFTCPSCWAFDFCELDEVGAPGAEEMKQEVTRHWEPYHQREIYAAETK